MLALAGLPFVKPLLGSNAPDSSAEQQRALAEQQRREQAAAQQRAQQEALQRARDQAAELRRQAEQASRERQARNSEAMQKAAARQQAEAQAKIASNLASKLERLQAQSNAINQAFQQIGELIQAQMERDRMESEARAAREEEREARREEQRQAALEQQLREQADAAARAQPQVADIPTPSPMSAPGESEGGAQPEPEVAPAVSSPSPSAKAGAGSSLQPPQPQPAQPQPAQAQPPQPSYSRFLPDQTAAPDPMAEAMGSVLRTAGVSEREVMGRVLGDLGPTAKDAVDDAKAIQRVIDDSKLARDTVREVRGEGDEGSTSPGQGILDRLYRRYSGERDGRLFGSDARTLGKGRAMEETMDRLQQRYADRIPETVRVETDAWRMLFARGASGDLVGHAKGHVDFAQRWVFDRMDLASPGTGSGTGAQPSAPSRPLLSTPTYSPTDDRESLREAQRAARAVSEAPDLQTRARHLHRVLDATDVLPTNTAARRDALYLRAAAAMDLGDPDTCRRVRFELRVYHADQEPTERERVLLRALEQECQR
jgi:hypothetical protein